MSDPLERLRQLAKQLPDDLVADWRGTNHYELASATHPGFWWYDHDERDDTEQGERLGLLLDIAAEVSRLKREGVL